MPLPSLNIAPFRQSSTVGMLPPQSSVEPASQSLPHDMSPNVPHKWAIDQVGRRRSAADGQYFAALTHQKHALGDPDQRARRELFNDQRPSPSWLGTRWNSWIRGGGWGSTGGYGSKNMVGIKDGVTANSTHLKPTEKNRTLASP